MLEGESLILYGYEFTDRDSAGYTSESELSQSQTSPASENHGMTECETEVEENLFCPHEMLGMTVDGFRSCLQVSWGKRMAIFDSGHIGIVPQNSTVGDNVVIALGCSMPLITRMTDEECGMLIGESYIHGVMDGQLLSNEYIVRVALGLREVKHITTLSLT